MKINFVKLKEEHLEEVMMWRQMPDITKWMYTDPKLTIKMQLEWYSEISKLEDSIFWIIQVDSTDIGLIAITDIDKKNRRCSWIYYIGDDSFRGKGLGKILEFNIYNYVFEKLDMNKLCCEVFEKNEKVVMLHKKCGQTIEGVLKEHINKNGCFHNIVLMSILKKNWDTLKNTLDYKKIEIE